MQEWGDRSGFRIHCFLDFRLCTIVVTRVIFTTIYRVLYYSIVLRFEIYVFAGSNEHNDYVVQYSFLLDNRYRTTLLSFHLNRNLISKVASLLLFTLHCTAHLRRHRGEMIPIAFFILILYSVPDVYNVKCIYFQMNAAFCIKFFLAGVSLRNRPYPDNKL